MTLGEKLKELRKARGWSTDKLGHKAGINPTCIRFYENDYRQPTVNVLRQLCNTLGVTLLAFHYCDTFPDARMDKEQDTPELAHS